MIKNLGSNRASKKHLGADGTFRMPRGNVSIAAKTALKVYTVTFVASGKTVAVFKVNYGGFVEAPKAPKIESDNLYSYDFVEWYHYGKEITRDITYTAVYRRTLIPREPADNDIGITASVMRYIVLLAATGAIFLFGAVPSLIIAVRAAAKARSHSSSEKFTKKGKKA